MFLYEAAAPAFKCLSSPSAFWSLLEEKSLVWKITAIYWLSCNCSVLFWVGRLLPQPSARHTSLLPCPAEFEKTYFQGNLADFGWHGCGSHDILRRMCSLRGSKLFSLEHGQSQSRGAFRHCPQFNCALQNPTETLRKLWNVAEVKAFYFPHLNSKTNSCSCSLSHTPVNISQHRLTKHSPAAVSPLTPWCGMDKTNQLIRDT